MTRFLMFCLLAVVILPLAACGDKNEGPRPPQEWTGKWNGPEGTGVDIQPVEGNPAAVTLTIQSLDSTDTYEGTIDGSVIRFTRRGIQETLRAGSGMETAMKWLLDYTDCLVVREGEGYCRGKPKSKG